jgi:hypothetical protein|nr:septum formation family protein [uncultured Corynebacterium sp.]
MKKTWRTTDVLRILIVAVLAAAAAFGGYYLMSPTKNSDGKTTHASKADDGKSTKPGVASFTSADAGSCLTWQDSGTTITAFEQTDCGGPHRFEVSSREDLSTYPSSEFGAKAAMPNTTRQAQLREELCMDPTMKYLGGTFDPLGRYSVASILPPQAAWNAGDRTLLCGIQATDEAGKVITTNGKVAQQDQARIFGVGECVAVDGANSEKQIDCTQPHQLEVTQIVDLLQVFPNHTPSIEDQDNHLRTVCTQAAKDYIGGDDQLYKSTLQPLWATIPANSWDRGSHSVNCSLMFNDNGHLGTLAGSAKGQFTINGQPPAERPDRAPIVNPEALQSVQPKPQ